MLVKTIIEDVGRNYKNMTESQLREVLNIDSTAKNVFELMVAKMIGCDGKINKADYLKSENALVKTIRVEENGKIRESMSFPTFKFTEIVKEKWLDSQLRLFFSGTKFLFIIFRKKKNEYIFDSLKLWEMPCSVLDTDVKNVWEYTKQLIENGNIVRDICEQQKTGKMIIKTNFPGSKFNGVCHVRPHAKNSSDVYPLPIADKKTGMTSFTKQCFWLNSSFIEEIINNATI